MISVTTRITPYLKDNIKAKIGMKNKKNTCRITMNKKNRRKKMMEMPMSSPAITSIITKAHQGRPSSKAYKPLATTIP